MKDLSEKKLAALLGSILEKASIYFLKNGGWKSKRQADHRHIYFLDNIYNAVFKISDRKSVRLIPGHILNRRSTVLFSLSQKVLQRMKP